MRCLATWVIFSRTDWRIPLASNATVRIQSDFPGKFVLSGGGK